ncbi:hypothetical protein BDF20DRAFT_995074 [Mycotypha africana]|uniref:uncharacterized protein n=1 Tax=Mycotypha africana TaxID=64632 RepID=UPI002300F086|nr:uncharacterized protein BDF20DRAFT_995074 [Mycotypha africana]KAI8975420.1 hypothetical protein BDF20DRAFT_995074 [Mycotypha africana]
MTRMTANNLTTCFFFGDGTAEDICITKKKKKSTLTAFLFFYSPSFHFQQKSGCPYNGARPMRNNTLSNRNVRPATTTRSSNNTLTVANLHFNVTEKDLYDLFGQIGPLKRAFLHIAPNGKSSGVADVVFVHGKDAERARNTYNNVELDGRPMRITFANVVASAPVSLNNNNNNNNTGRRTNLRGGNTRGRGGPRRRDNRPKPSEDQLDADMDSYMNNNKKLIEEFQKKISPEYLNNEKFKPVPNPLFHLSPLTSPTSSTDSISLGKSENSVEAGNKPTPAQLQGFAAEKYVPSPGYAHLDPSKSANAHSAFEHLQRVIEASTPLKHQPMPRTRPHVQQQTLKASSEPPRNQSVTMPHATSNKPFEIVIPQQQQQQQQKLQTQQQQQIHPPPQKHSTQQQQQQQQQRPRDVSAKQKPSARPDRLIDGAPVLEFCRALWSYNAQIPSELTFKANDTLAIINKQPDGWWYAELVDPSNTVKKRRGLVPGNYMTPVK